MVMRRVRIRRVCVKVAMLSERWLAAVHRGCRSLCSRTLLEAGMRLLFVCVVVVAHIVLPVAHHIGSARCYHALLLCMLVVYIGAS